MSDTNGSIPDFTHDLVPFTVEGHTFQRRKIPARQWAETLNRVSNAERVEDEKSVEDGRLMFAVSTDGLFELVTLGVREEDRSTWMQLWEDGLLEFGELAALRDWMWEQITARPFQSDTPSSSGPGESSEASSKDESSSPAEVVTG
jgi:hypothetical protein